MDQGLQLLEDFKVSKRSLAVRTRETYAYEVRRLLEYLEGKAINEVESEDLETYLRSHMNWTPRTANRAMAAFNSFWKYLVRRKVAGHNVAADLERYKLKDELAGYLKDYELKHIRRQAKADPLVEIMVDLFYYTGCRLSELLGANLASLDLEVREIKVLGKGGRERYVRFPPSLKAPLEIYLLWRFTKVDPEEVALLVSPNSKTRINRNQVEYLFRKLSQRAGVHVHPHKLRHTFATDAAAAGMDPAALKELLGHSHISTTYRYIHITPDVVKAYDEVFA